MVNLSAIPASQVMHSPVITANPESTLEELAEEFNAKRISGMPVVDNGKMIGVVTQTDLNRIPLLLDSLAGYVHAELMESGPAVEDEDRNHNGIPDNLESFRQQMARMTVRDAMRRQVITCSPDDSIQVVIERMTASHVHRLIVTDDENPVGVISSLDILALITKAGQTG